MTVGIRKSPLGIACAILNLIVSAVIAGDWGDPTDLHNPPQAALGFPSQDTNLDVLPGFRNPPPGYGEVPFWWWTGDPLDKERLLWQIEQLHSKGISGMQVNYAHRDTPGWPTYPAEPEVFSEEWWEFWKFTAEECGKRSMGIGLSSYTLDWPGGKNLFNRIIYSDPEIQGLELAVASEMRAEAGQSVSIELPQEFIGVRAYRLNGTTVDPGGIDLAGSIRERKLDWTPGGGNWEVWVFEARRRPQTLNPMHPLAGRRVIERFFQPFEDHAPNQSSAGLNYFFQDELKFGVGDHIWVDDFSEVFRQRKGYDVFEVLPALFTDIGPLTAKARLDFMDVKVQLAEERYFRPIFDWHWKRGKIYGCDQGGRGRDPMEFGDYFRCVRWYTAPGHDTPGGNADLIKGKVSSSIAHLYRRPRVWLEGYHSLGWGATPERLMKATCENYIYGCTLLNLHGLYYTTHGGFWEWAPPCYHFRMPYWDHMEVFLKYFERLSYLLSQGVHCCDVAVMYPVAPLQADMGGREATDTAFAAGTRLFSRGYDFDFMDWQSLGRAEVHDGQLHVSGESYRVLVLPAMRAVRWSTLQKALEFFRAGGIVLAIGALPEASDHAGSNDSQLDTVVKELFGVSAAEAQAGALPSMQRSNSGGVGIAALPGQVQNFRRYEGGYEGPWVWSKEHTSDVYFKAVWQSDSPTGDECRIKLLCDNSGALYVNGRQLCKSADYGTGWTGRAVLKNNDVITIDAHDDDAGNHSAGLFVAIVRDGGTVLSSRDFHYTTNRPVNGDWRTSSDTERMAAPSTENIHAAHKSNQGDVLSVLDKIARFIPADVQSKSPIMAVHRRIGRRDVYMVMGAPRGSECIFQSRGRVELWDPWTGENRPLYVVSTIDEGTKVRMPLQDSEAQVIVFNPEEETVTVEATDLDEVTDVRFENGRVTVAGYSTTAGEVTAAVNVKGRRVTVRGWADAIPAPIELDGEWQFELKPTLDNRWGDFRLPATEKTIGPEARVFRYAREQTTDSGWQDPRFDDSTWPQVTYGFGQKLWKLGPLPQDIDVTELNARLTELDHVDPAVGVDVEGKTYTWQPYSFSWRLGVEGDPGHQGYHGLKENVTDDFICLGQPKGGLNETLYAEENEGSRYYLWTTALSPEEIEANIAAGGLKPAAVYLNGERLADMETRLKLRSGNNPLLLRYDRPGRGHFVLERNNTGEKRERTPLAMQWYDMPGLVLFDAYPSPVRAAGWYRFTAPPGLHGMTAIVHGNLEGWVNGRPLRIEQVVPQKNGAMQYKLRLEKPAVEKSTVALRVKPIAGFYGGSAIPEPIKLECGAGLIALGDWSKGSALECYSGGACYRKSMTLTAEQVQGRVVLDLGEVVATAEVLVNGRVAGIRVAPPWIVDITECVKVGDNQVEVLVYNTLANQYLTVPTP